MYFHKTPKLLQWLYPGLIWRKRSKSNNLYLTFDDGPVPEATPEVLDILNKYNVKATFFCVGENIQKHPEVFNRVVEEGHLVGNHTHNHINGWKQPIKDYVLNVLKCDNQMQEQGVASKIFRPPYGKIKRWAIQKLKRKGFHIIMWDVLSGDFDANLSKDQCLKKSIKATQAGSIIIFHDSIKSIEKTREVLPAYIKHFQQQGYKFSTL